jgi:hypothetical protein
MHVAANLVLGLMGITLGVALYWARTEQPSVSEQMSIMGLQGLAYGFGALRLWSAADVCCRGQPAPRGREAHDDDDGGDAGGRGVAAP